MTKTTKTSQASLLTAILRRREGELARRNKTFGHSHPMTLRYAAGMRTLARRIDTLRQTQIPGL